MYKIFGRKINGFDYQIRRGVFAVIFNNTKDKVLTVQNSRGHFFYLVAELRRMKVIKNV